MQSVVALRQEGAALAKLARRSAQCALTRYPRSETGWPTRYPHSARELGRPTRYPRSETGWAIRYRSEKGWVSRYLRSETGLVTQLRDLV